MKSGELQLLLRFDSVDAHDLKARRGLRRELEQRRLPDPDLTSHHDRLAPPGPGGVQERSDGLPFPCTDEIPTGLATAGLVDALDITSAPGPPTIALAGPGPVGGHPNTLSIDQ
jgi:hypothetical protein